MSRLYVIATPIGNLQDLSPRAIDTLKNADLIAAEDTRVTAKICQVFDIHTPMTSCHRHNEESKGSQIAQRMLSEDLTVALTTDAGTPGISDPGYGLVSACAALGMDIQPIPGCCAAVAALSISGFDTRQFTFYGFLPREKKELREKLTEIRRNGHIAVLHESPYRVIELTRMISEVMPKARLIVCCDLTKLHEKTLRGTPVEILQELEANPKAEKGEYCLVLDLNGISGGSEEAPTAFRTLEAELVEAMTTLGLSLRDAADEISRRGYKKNAVKQAALHLKKMIAE